MLGERSKVDTGGRILIRAIIDRARAVDDLWQPDGSDRPAIDIVDDRPGVHARVVHRHQ